MIVLLALFAISMAAATFIERAYGTILAKVAIYYSPLFFLLQFLLVVNFVMIVIRHHLLKIERWGLLSIHFSFIVILTGALITHIFGKEGTLYLREGEVSNRIEVQTNQGNSVLTLPFQVELIKFTLTRYPGSLSPSSYESDLIVYVDGKTQHERVYMNNVLDVKGYRFYQASYDADEAGTILSVTKDVVGRRVTYTGYLLLLLGCIGCLTGRNGRLRTLIRKLKPTVTPRHCELAKQSGSKPFHGKERSILIAITGLLLTFPGRISAEITPKTMADAVQQMVIQPTHAERFGALPVLSTNGRIIPLNTFSSEILRKLHKNTRFGKLNSDMFLLSLLAKPEMWMHVPLISYSNDAIADYFSIPRDECTYADMFREDGSYKLQGKLNEAYRKTPTERSGFDKELIKLDEKVNILYQLFDYQLIRLFPKPDDPEKSWYAPGDDLSGFSGQDSMFVSRIFYWYLSEVQSAMETGDWSKANETLDMIAIYQSAKNNLPEFDKKKIALELKYNKLDVFRWCKTGYLSLGGLLLLFSFIFFFNNRPWGRWVIRLFGIGILIVFHFHMLGMAMRWNIGGYAPWSNSYETMVFLAWTVVLAGLLFARRSTVTFSLATLFAGIILFVSGLNWMDPHINPLVPVLKSPWLMFHVAILMAAYGFFGISCLLGLVNLLMMALLRKSKHPIFTGSIRELSIVNEIALFIGLILMSVGTFMGAVWANESWGRYWGWDPKETWALITLIVYVIVTHLHLLKKWYSLWLLNLCSIISFASVMMTYFGVNYILSGMHSYGQSDHISGVFAYLCGVAVLILLLAVFAWKGKELIRN